MSTGSWLRTGGMLLLTAALLVLLESLDEPHRDVREPEPVVPADSVHVQIPVTFEIVMPVDEAAPRPAGSDSGVAAASQAVETPARSDSLHIPGDSPPRVQGHFEYSEELASEGLPLLSDRPVIIRASYAELGLNGYLQALRRLGGRAFVVRRGRSGFKLVAEVEPLSGRVLQPAVNARDVRGLALRLPREVSQDHEAQELVRRAATELGLEGDLRMVVLLPAKIEAYSRAGLQRALASSGFRIRNFRSFEGRYVRAGQTIELHLRRGIRRDGTHVSADVILRLTRS